MMSKCGYIYGKCTEKECKGVGQSCKDGYGAAYQAFCCDGLICKEKYESDDWFADLVEAKCENPEYEYEYEQEHHGTLFNSRGQDTEKNAT